VVVTRAGSLGIRMGLIHFQKEVDSVLYGPVPGKGISFSLTILVIKVMASQAMLVATSYLKYNFKQEII
jgi:hypothetical protein